MKIELKTPIAAADNPSAQEALKAVADAANRDPGLFASIHRSAEKILNKDGETLRDAMTIIHAVGPGIKKDLSVKEAMLLLDLPDTLDAIESGGRPITYSRDFREAIESFRRPLEKFLVGVAVPAFDERLSEFWRNHNEAMTRWPVMPESKIKKTFHEDVYMPIKEWADAAYESYWLLCQSIGGPPPALLMPEAMEDWKRMTRALAATDPGNAAQAELARDVARVAQAFARDVAPWIRPAVRASDPVALKDFDRLQAARRP